MISINEVFKAVADDNGLFQGYARLVGLREDFAYLISHPIDPGKKQMPPNEGADNGNGNGREDHHPPVPSCHSTPAAKQVISDFNKKRIKRLLLKTPFKVPVDALIYALQQGQIEGNQAFVSDVPVSRYALSEAARAALDSRIRMMRPVLSEEDLLYNDELRTRVFSKHAAMNDVDERTIQRLYNAYLWGGQTELALAPAFHYRGGPGSAQKAGMKRGRRPEDGSPESCDVPLYVFRDKLIKGIKKFYKGSNTLNKAYVDTLKKYFSKGCKVMPGQELEDILLPRSERPTRRQFRYMCGITAGKRNIHPGRSRQKEPEREFRGRARDDVKGPGSRFEIDASKQQIQLVSVLDRKLVGSPTIYMMIDAWSGAIVGYAISFESAGWPLARTALFNCFQDKKETFKRLELDYASSRWPCHHLPAMVTADRGELAGARADAITEFGIVLRNTPAYRPQSKGMVEWIIKEIKRKSLRNLRGSFAKAPKRGEPDGKRQATFNIFEFERRFVQEIVLLNDRSVPIEYIPPEMIRDGVKKISHTQLYSWGIENRPGETRLMDAQHALTYLLTEGTASITARGISFREMNFTSPILLVGRYHLKAARTKNSKIDIRYDEHSVKKIWFRNILTNEWETAENDSKEICRFDPGFPDAKNFRNTIKRLRSAVDDENDHQRGEVDKRFNETAQNARKETRELTYGTPGSVKKSGMKKRMTREKGLVNARRNSSGNGASGPSRRVGDHPPDDVSSESRKREKAFIERKNKVMRRMK